MLFFSSFAKQMPVVHPHAWTTSRAPPLLVGAMQACGALYVKTRVANAFIASTLAQARDPLVAQFVRANDSTIGMPSHLDNHRRKKLPLWMTEYTRSWLWLCCNHWVSSISTPNNVRLQ